MKHVNTVTKKNMSSQGHRRIFIGRSPMPSGPLFVNQLKCDNQENADTHT